MSKIISTIMLYVVLFAILIGSSCQNMGTHPKKYTSYICYDYHLACTEYDKNAGASDIEYYDIYYDGSVSDTPSKLRASFYTIPGVSDEQFISANTRRHHLLDITLKRILQNPDNYVDVWKEWTVKKIEIYRHDINQEHNKSGSAISPAEILAVTSDKDCIADITRFVFSNDDVVDWGSFPPDGFKNETRNDANCIKYYIRVHFNEAENIIWDTEFTSYYSEENGERIIISDQGKDTEDFSSANRKDVIISDYTYLNAWISEVMSQISAK